LIKVIVMRKPSLFIAFGSLLVVAFLPRCGNGTTDCTQTSTCPSDASDGPPALNCDTAKDPKDQPGCLDDRVGVFVDGANGKDTNAGTKEAPFQTIGKALATTGTLTRVYVCEGIYPEDVAITPPVDGISVYGGFKCIAWTYTGNQPQVGKTQIALKISGTTKAFTIQDMLFHAADGNAGSSTSIGALVANASGVVTFNRVNIVAGVGVTPADAAAGSNFNASLLQSDASVKGHDANGASGGALQTCGSVCTDTISATGGQGGAGGAGPGDGSNGLPSLGGGAKGVASASCGSGGTGGDGSNATAVGADAVSPTVLGALTDTGWAPGAAAAGKNGAPGQGGGGGAGQTDTNTSGGGGGGACGGCGGGGGGGGAGGGGSIALAALNSTINMTSSQLHAGDAGNGGKGAAGQTGQLGGYKGNGVGNGCSGGKGGNGSAGGTGAGGVGGISVALLYKGTQPTTDGNTSGQMVVGKAGTKGVGGKAGSNDGIDGVAQPFLAAP
jgi:hypothetical protein